MIDLFRMTKRDYLGYKIKAFDVRTIKMTTSLYGPLHGLDVLLLE